MYRALFACLLSLSLLEGVASAQTSLTIGEYGQEVHTPFTMTEGLPSNNVTCIDILNNGQVFAGTDKGLAEFKANQWHPVKALDGKRIIALAVDKNILYTAIATSDTTYEIRSLENKKLSPILRNGAEFSTMTVSNGVLWVGNSDGISSYTIKTKQSNYYHNLNQHPLEKPNDSRFSGYIFGISVYNDEVVVAANSGLYIQRKGFWELILPSFGTQRWAPVDVRAVHHNNDGELWFACKQGVGFRDQWPDKNGNQWNLFTGKDGLPYNNFTAIGGNRSPWFSSQYGAINFTEKSTVEADPGNLTSWRKAILREPKNWDYRQGRRWLINDIVRDVAVAPNGDAWFATAGGVSRIAQHPITLAKKAAFYESEIDKYHKRTPYGYVTNAKMDTPGDKASAKAYVTDNDGQYTGLYTAAISLGYGATGDPALKARATEAFEALAFLSEVTQGGTHPAPKGFIARAIMPTDGWNPNERDNAERDRKKRAESDHLWKILEPRWPIDESGKWYWKTDTSSDELDGHFFAYGTYYDNVAETEEEKERCREVVARVADHLLKHNFRLVDHDGTPTRWADFSPKALNKDRNHWTERGLNSMSMLTYLSIAHHITGDKKYRDAYMNLIEEHDYALNGMVMPKLQFGPGSHVQFDDKMSFMNYYHLIRYETDPELLNMYYTSIYYYWNIVKQETNPFFNFVYAACCRGKIRQDQWGDLNVSPTGDWLQQSVDTLKDYPLDLIDWKHTNAHRIDLIGLGDHTREPGKNIGHGYRVNGLVIPIDETQSLSWSEDRWRYDTGGDGTRLRDGAPYLLGYYMGLKHGFIKEK